MQKETVMTAMIEEKKEPDVIGKVREVTIVTGKDSSDSSRNIVVKEETVMTTVKEEKAEEIMVTEETERDISDRRENSDRKHIFLSGPVHHLMHFCSL